MDYQLYALLRRDSCNNGVDLNGVDLKQPIDLFRHIYSYACGDSYANATIPILEDCDIVDFGTCSFGGVNIIPSDLFPLTESDESWLEVFEDWMISAMVEISLLVTVCLPIDLDPCTELIDDVLAEDEINFQHMIDSYDEVSRNIIATTNCVIGGVVPSLAATPTAPFDIGSGLNLNPLRILNEPITQPSMDPTKEE